MSKSISIFSALLCTFIWGTTFIAQDTGMDNIGPFTFNAVRFFVGFLAITPLVILFELKNFKPELKTDKKTFIIYVSLIGLSLFLGSALQQVALLYTDVANAAFFTIFYVPMVPIIIYLFGKKSIHWSVWPSVILCLIGGYLLTNFYDATVRLGDTLVVLGALFWSTHIIFTGIIIFKYNLPLTIGAIQTLIVAILSFLIGILYEEFVWNNILMEIYSILYAGILSGGFAFVLQIYAQKNITPAPAAIIFSLEGVFATVAAWFILNQVLDINNILGCFFILCGVLLSQLLPLIKRTKNLTFSINKEEQYGSQVSKSKPGTYGAYEVSKGKRGPDFIIFGPTGTGKETEYPFTIGDKLSLEDGYEVEFEDGYSRKSVIENDNPFEDSTSEGFIIDDDLDSEDENNPEESPFG